MDSAVRDCPYFHGTMNRNEAVTYLENRSHGSFLLRKSPNRNDGSFAISVVTDGKVIHYSIEKVPNKPNAFRINNGSIHENPCAVVEHYIHTKGGLKCQLIYPVLNKEIQNLNPSTKPVDDYIDLVNDDLNNNKFEVNRPIIRSAPWFHGSISREEDTKRLTEYYKKFNQNGSFLVREKDAEKYVLSFINNNNLHRYMILKSGNGLYIDGKEKELFSSLTELIEHHINFPVSVTGIKCQLTKPCPLPESPKPKKELQPAKLRPIAEQLLKITPQNILDLNWSKSKTAESRNNSTSSTDVSTPGENFVTKSEKIVQKRFQQSFKKKSLPNETIGFVSPFYSNTYLDLPKEIYLPKENISIYEQLGSGHFGAVHLGRCVIKGQGVPCAVKFLNGEDMEVNKSEIIIEAKIMQKLDHPHIVRLFGICETDDLKIIMELAPLGTFHSCLKNRCKFTQSQLILILKQISDGMTYLSQQNVVHRDLAARNVLLVSENFAKVSDFGMSRLLQESENYYKSTNPGVWPLRWYAPECLLYYKFTSKSDVWSFGITMWEALSHGKKPYRNMTGREIIEYLEADKRLEKPFACSDELFEIMQKCWEYDAVNRPSFDSIHAELTVLHEVSVLPPLILKTP